MDAKELDKRFDHHPPTGGKVQAHENTRAAFKTLARILNETIPAGREQACALTALEESLFWSNAAIARNELSAPGSEKPDTQAAPPRPAKR